MQVQPARRSTSTVDACWRVVHVLAAVQDPNPTILAAARDEALNPTTPGWVPVNQINGVALWTNGRTHMINNVIGSTAPGEVAFAAEVDEVWRHPQNPQPGLVEERLYFVLRRETVWPGDFNRDGVVDQQDLEDFDTAYQAAVDEYIDWNMDGNWPHPADIQAFLDSHAASKAAPCP